MSLRRPFMLSTILTLTMLAFAVVCAPRVANAQESNVVSVAGDDADMNAAIAQARASLPEFEAFIDKNPGAVPVLKVGIAHSDGVEHIWMQLDKIENGRYIGRIMNVGVKIPQRPGDYYEASPDIVSDWMIRMPPLETGDIYGGYTVRVLMRLYPDSTPPDYKERLKDLPKG